MYMHAACIRVKQTAAYVCIYACMRQDAAAPESSGVCVCVCVCVCVLVFIPRYRYRLDIDIDTYLSELPDAAAPEHRGDAAGLSREEAAPLAWR